MSRGGGGAKPRGRKLLWLSLVVILMAGALVSSTANAGPDPVPRQPPWQRLGPIGPRPADLVAVAPGRPREQALLGARNQIFTAGLGLGYASPELVLSRDGGRSWQAMPSPASSLEGLRLETSPGGGRVGVAWSKDVVYLSDDLGGTWQSVLAPQDAGIDDVQLSPNFASDGLAFSVASGTLWRSRDSGRTWSALEPVQGQWVHRLRFSPNFGVDGMLFVALAGGAFPTGFPEITKNGAPAGDPDSSAGVLVSTDRGDTWSPVNTGLEVDGEAYQAMAELEISPTFARDHTLFALGWGPFETVRFYNDSEMTGQRAALFRSQDNGASWEPVQTFEPSVTRFHMQLAFSPDYATDHIALQALVMKGLTPASHSCTVSWSDDAGASWIEKIPPTQYDWCQHLQAFRSSRGGFEATVLKPGGRHWSPDSGRTWGLASTPTSVSAIVVAAPVDLPASTLFIAGDGGIWSYGPGAVATDGMLPCAFTPTLGFGRVWSANVEVRAALGCGIESEHPIRVRQREHVNQYCGPTRVLWPDDPGVPFFFELTNSTCNPVAARPKASNPPPPEGPEREFQGTIQLFEGGAMLFLVRPDSGRSILVLPHRGQWAEYPDY